MSEETIYKESDCPLCGGKGKIRSPFCDDDEDPDIRPCHHEVHDVEDLDELQRDINKTLERYIYASWKRIWREVEKARENET